MGSFWVRTIILLGHHHLGFLPVGPFPKNAKDQCLWTSEANVYLVLIHHLYLSDVVPRHGYEAPGYEAEPKPKFQSNHTAEADPQASILNL